MFIYITITIIAFFCFLSILQLKKKQRVSKRAYQTLVIIGPFSWAVQMGLLSLMADSLLVSSVVSIAVLLAVTCFWQLVRAVRNKRVSGSSAAQAILWGELVFPLVLVSLLPNGAWTLFNLF